MSIAPLVAPAPVDTEGDAPVLDVRELRTTFRSPDGDLPILDGISFTLHAGQTLTILGESGSGKSVTIRSILRLYGSRVAHHSGTALVDGRDVLQLDDAAMLRLRGGRISMVQQDPTTTLDPLRRVGAQLVEAIRLHRVARTRAEATATAADLLAAVGIPDPQRVLRAYPHQISGGMRQRVAIAIAISTRPGIVFADEPTSALDVTVQAQVLDLFRSLQRDLGLALVLITHDVGVAREMGGDVAVMYAGRIVEQGPAALVLDRPRHPYTAALLDSLPEPGTPRGELRVIAGAPPTPAERAAAGCSFAPRCARALPICSAITPEPAPSDGARIECHNPLLEDA